jgi:hypothetical protein
MKKCFLYIVCLLVFILISCPEIIDIIATDVVAFSDITVINESSYDLHISFVVDKTVQSKDDYKDINLTKNQSIVFTVGYYATGYNNYPRPYIDIKRIIFSDSTTGKIIKTLDNNLENIILTNVDGRHADYLLKITNNLLE